MICHPLSPKGGYVSPQVGWVGGLRGVGDGSVEDSTRFKKEGLDIDVNTKLKLNLWEYYDEIVVTASKITHFNVRWRIEWFMQVLTLTIVVSGVWDSIEIVFYCLFFCTHFVPSGPSLTHTCRKRLRALTAWLQIFLPSPVLLTSERVSFASCLYSYTCSWSRIINSQWRSFSATAVHQWEHHMGN